MKFYVPRSLLKAIKSGYMWFFEKFLKMWLKRVENG